MKKILALLFVFVVCLPLIASFFMVSMNVDERMQAILAQQAATSLKVVEKQIESTIEEIALKARIISQMSDVQTAAVEGDKIALIDRLDLARHDLGLTAYEASVEVYSADSKLIAAEPSLNLPVGNSVANALAGNISLDRFFTDSGLIVRSTYPMYFQENPAPSGAISVVFSAGNLFAHRVKQISNADIILGRINDDELSFHASTLSLDNELDALSTFLSASSGARIFNLNDRDLIFDRLLIDVVNGVLLVAVGIDASQLTLTIKSLQSNLLFIAIGAVLFALLLALLYSRKLLVPINTLVTAANRLGAGQLDTPVCIKTDDEFGLLGDTFDLMRQKIKRNVEELHHINATLDRKVFDLSVRNMINETIINRNDESIFREMLQIIVKLMEIERASILLTDPNTNCLTMKVTACRNSDSEEPFTANMQFRVGEGIAGIVAETGKPLMSNNPVADESFKSYGNQELDNTVKNLLTVPLRGGDQIIGVINLSNKSDPFIDEDKMLMTDIADQIAIAIQKAQLYELAITDGMTGLYIRRYFMLRLESEMARVERTNEKMSLLIFDIDHFKKFNDTYGHQLGDQVIKMVADTARNSLRVGLDVLARIGGEEFAVILPGTDCAGAIKSAERLRLAVASGLVAHEDQELKVTISIGCSTCPDKAKDPESIIKCADSALYKSKESGRNCVSSA